MKKNLFKGISFTVGASLWWGIIGVIYFKFVSYASPLELTIHRTIWTALLLILTTSYYSKWKEFNKIIKNTEYKVSKIFDDLSANEAKSKGKLKPKEAPIRISIGQ